MEWILLFVVGFLAGTVGSLVGLGGGIIIVPALLYLAGFHPSFQGITPSVAVGTSLLLIVLTALSSTLSFLKQKRVDVKSGFTFFLACGPGAMVGASLTRLFQSDSFFVAFGCLMIFVSWLLRVKEKGATRKVRLDVMRTFTDAAGTVHEYGYHRLTALGLSFLVGVISGLFGIGGGSLLVPMMILLFRFPPHVATATSMLIIFLSSIVASVTHVVQGNIHWISALVLAPGAWVGGKIGAWISSKLSSRALLNLLRIAILVTAVRMIMDGLNLI
ncbi:sulfite exporter TauE/SafE family protein [Laceyella putida]|uniref:Probable membrane transporter protein n=1 Tax=Laceyella putida TaxID=110101 RepID=A0ABW2RQF6_9BACL